MEAGMYCCRGFRSYQRYKWQEKSGRKICSICLERCLPACVMVYVHSVRVNDEDSSVWDRQSTATALCKHRPIKHKHRLPTCCSVKVLAVSTHTKGLFVCVCVLCTVYESTEPKTTADTNPTGCSCQMKPCTSNCWALNRSNNTWHRNNIEHS